MKKLFKILLLLPLLLFVLVAIAVSAIAAWAYYEPRDLSRYKPQIEQAINSVMKDNSVKIGSATLEFGGLGSPLEVAAKNVFIYDSGNNEQVRVKELDFSYGLRELIFGNFIPSTLVLVGVKVDGSRFFESTDDSSINLQDFNFSSLKKLQLKDGVVAFPNMGEEWKVENITLAFSGNKTNISGKVMPTADEMLVLGGKGYPKKGDFDIHAQLTNFSLARLKYFAAELGGVNANVNGIIIGNFKGGKIAAASLDVKSANGTIETEKLKTPLVYKTAHITAGYDFTKQTATIVKSAFEFADGFKLSTNGAYSKTGDIKLNATFSDLGIDNIKNYWPKDIGENAIGWMSEHLSGGNIPSGTAKIDIKGADFKKNIVPENAVALHFDVVGTDVNYTDNLLPVKSASGKAFMDANSLNIKISDGGLGSSRISNVIVDITEIGKEQELLRVEGDINGNAKDLADFYVKVNKSRGKALLFESANDIAGNASTHLVVKLPLIGALRFEQVSVNLKSKISGGIINSKAKNFAAKGANLILELNDAGYSVKGAATAGYVNAAQSLDFTNIPLKFNVSEKAGKMSAVIDADITSSEIGIKQLGIKKPKLETGRLGVVLSGSNLSRVELDSASLKISASGTLTPALNDVSTLKITNFESEGNKFKANIVNNNGYNILLDAVKINAAQILKDVGEGKGLKDDKDKTPATRINIKATIAKMFMHQGQVLENVNIVASCADDCEAVKLDSKDLQITKTPEKLVIKAPDAGKILKMLDAYDDMKGGTLEVEAKGIGNGGYDGIVTIVDFNLVRAKVLAKILTLGSLTGIADTMQGNGIAFKKLKTNFKWDENHIKVENFRMFGAAIGATTDGTLDRKTDKLDFTGKIIPAYTANTLLGKIPILGDIIIGDTGVFAFAFTVKGTTEEPEVFVNPLSVLAPGFLQEIFQ